MWIGKAPQIVRCASFLKLFCFRSDEITWKARMTGKPERPESRNDRKAGTTGKSERPESCNDRKAGTTGRTGMNAAPIYWRPYDPCANRQWRMNSLRQYFKNYISRGFFRVRGTNSIGAGSICAPILLAGYKRDWHVMRALPIYTAITYSLSFSNRKRKYMK